MNDASRQQLFDDVQNLMRGLIAQTLQIEPREYFANSAIQAKVDDHLAVVIRVAKYAKLDEAIAVLLEIRSMIAR